MNYLQGQRLVLHTLSSNSGSEHCFWWFGHIFRKDNPKLWYLDVWMWSAFNIVANPRFVPQGNNFFHGVKFSVQTFSPGNIPNFTLFLEDCVKIPEGLKLHFGFIDCVESKKFKEAQNCPASALVSFFQDLSRSKTSKRYKLMTVTWKIYTIIFLK